MVDVKVVLLQQLLAPLCSCGSQLDVADGDFCAGLDGLQCCENYALLAEALHGIGRAGVVDQGSSWEQAHTYTPSSTSNSLMIRLYDSTLSFRAVLVTAHMLPYASNEAKYRWQGCS